MTGKLKSAGMGCCILTGLSVILLWPGTPWSDSCWRGLKRTIVKTHLRIARLEGKTPAIVSLSGRLTGHGAYAQMVKGAQVTFLQSTSGYSASSDARGRFVVPHLLWHPRAAYDVFVTGDTYTATHFKVTAPAVLPAEAIVDLGELRLEEGEPMADERAPTRFMQYDAANDDYYRGIFQQVTARAENDAQRIDAVAGFVATKLNYNEPAWSFKSPREVLERGSCYCSNLALAMAAITAAANYPTRTVHISDTADYQHTHVMVEVYYGDQWHLYDSTYGVRFLNRQGVVACYRELRLDPGLISSGTFHDLEAGTIQEILEWMPSAYASGFHQIYLVVRNDMCAAG
jgi:hypothetical protein